MGHEILFTERQKFKQWWIWIILLGINGLFIFGVFRQVIDGQQFRNKPMSNTKLSITIGLMFLFTLVFMTFRLDTIIRNIKKQVQQHIEKWLSGF